MRPEGIRCEVLRGEKTDEDAERLLAYWSEHGALGPEDARARLDEVVCELRDPAGEVVGTSSAYPAAAEELGGLPVWVHRSHLSPRLPADRGEAWTSLLSASFDALQEEFRALHPGPLGLCALIPSDQPGAPRTAAWPETGFAFAGRGADGAEIRVRQFDESDPLPGGPAFDLPAGVRIEPFAQSEVSAEDVIEFWLRAGALDSREEAVRRVDEVLMVAVSQDAGIVAVNTAYLDHCDQIGSVMWHYRIYVSRRARKGDLATVMSRAAREILSAAHSRGDSRAPGIVMEIQSPLLRRIHASPRWRWIGVELIGLAGEGDHLRVHWFPDVAAPLPSNGY